VKWSSQSAAMREGAMAFLNSTQMEKQATNRNEMFKHQKEME